MMKKVLFFTVSMLVIAILSTPAMAGRYDIGGRPFYLAGQVSQGVAYGLNDGYDTKKDINALIWTALLDADYYPSEQSRFFTQLSLTGNWIYDFNNSDSEWIGKQFNASHGNLAFDDKYWQIIREAHYTWNTENSMVRIGKQIISWGQTDGFRLMDQINPADQRRGLADVEYETSIIPLWLARADFSPKIESTWLQDLSVQLWFNPNADFIPNQPITLGNDVGGIWAPLVVLGTKTYLGSSDITINTPGSGDHNYFEYGARIQGMVNDALITLNGFYGRDNDYVAQSAGAPRVETVDGNTIVHLNQKAFYPYQRFVGGTLTKDLVFLQKAMLGHSPVLRLEAFYAFQSTFVDSLDNLVEKDEVRWALGLDWKLYIRPINEKAGIGISAQVYERRILDYPTVGLSGLKEDNWMSTLFVSTAYLSDRLSPSVFLMFDHTNDAYLIKPQISYLWDSSWSYTLGALFLGGNKEGQGFQLFDNKDYIFFKVAYRWN